MRMSREGGREGGGEGGEKCESETGGGNSRRRVLWMTRDGSARRERRRSMRVEV